MKRLLRCVPLVALLAAGCAAPLATVSGRVTWKGAPVADAVLSFQPPTDPSDAFPGTSRETGAYHVTYRGGDGMPVGKYRVTITRHFLRGGKPLPEGEAGAEAKGSGKALSETVSFEKELVAGPNVIDFELSEGTRVKE